MSATLAELGGVAAGASVFRAVWIRALHHDIHESEAAVNAHLNKALPDQARWPLWAVMQLGSLGGGVAVAALANRRDVPAAATAVGAVGASWLGVKVVKAMTRRGRPRDHLPGVVIRGEPATGYGFPSGHAAVAAAAAVGVAGRVPAPVLAGALAAAGATSFARIYMGAHLPLDVVGGAALGVAVGCAGRLVRGRFG